MTTTNPSRGPVSRIAAAGGERAALGAAESRDCGGCGRPIPPAEPVCIYGRGGHPRQEYEARCGECVADHVHQLRANDRETAAEYVEKWFVDVRDCEVCGRPIRAHHSIVVCSLECRDARRATRRRREREEARSSPIPESVTCKACGTKVGRDFTIVQNDGRLGGDLCESCYTAKRRENDAAQVANPGPFAHLFPVKDPADPD